MHSPAGLPDVAGMSRAITRFIVLWISLGIAAAVFYSKASYRTKKAAHPYIAAGFGLLFLAFVEWFTQGKLPVLLVVAVILISFLNIKMTQFCAQCGATVHLRRFSRARFCAKCGAELPSTT
jgi:hypothetical protein